MNKTSFSKNKYKLFYVGNSESAKDEIGYGTINRPFRTIQYALANSPTITTKVITFKGKKTRVIVRNN